MSLHAKLSQRVPVDAVAVESKHPHTCPNCGVLNEFTSGQVKQYRPCLLYTSPSPRDS